MCHVCQEVSINSYTLLPVDSLLFFCKLTIMNEKIIRVAVAGAGGRMGGRIIALASESSEFKVIGALEASGHPVIGRDAGIVAGCGEIKVVITSDCTRSLEGADVLIDFTSPSATIEHIQIALQHNVPMVIGTTGLEKDGEKIIEQASKKIPLIAAPNMSVGVNLLFRIAPLIAETLGEDYDIEIIEAHHNKKKDAPSGTAMKLLDLVSSAAGIEKENSVFGRKGLDAKRKPREIGVHAVRAGDIVGEHTVIFATTGERIEVTHRASSRDTFALGALRAAKFLIGKPAGKYSMADVLFKKDN